MKALYLVIVSLLLGSNIFATARDDKLDIQRFGKEEASMPIKTEPPAKFNPPKITPESTQAPTYPSVKTIKQNAPSQKKPWGKRWTINKIIRRVNGANILASDLKEPRVYKEGKPYTLDELTLEELLFQKATESHMVPSTADVDRQVTAFKIQNMITSDEEFEKELKESGFTLSSYKNQLGRLMAAENVRRAELSERALVTSQEVEKYYKRYPEYVNEAVKMEISAIPSEQVKSYKSFVRDHDAVWHDLGWIEKKDIGSEFSFVRSMSVGDISRPVKIDGTYKLIKLVGRKERRLKTLTERYGSIQRKLHDEKKQEFLKGFEAEILKTAHIVDL